MGLEAEPLPDDLDVIRGLIDEHQGFMDNLSSRQPEIDAVCKPMRPKSQAPYRQTPVGFGSSTPRKTSTPVNGKGRTPSNSSMDRTPMAGRTRTPTTGSAIQRSGSGLSDNRRTSKTTTSYGADGSRITSTTSTYSSNYENSGEQSSRQNW